MGARAYTDNKGRDTFGRVSVLETLREAVELEVDGATAREVLDSSLPQEAVQHLTCSELGYAPLKAVLGGVPSLQWCMVSRCC